MDRILNRLNNPIFFVVVLILYCFLYILFNYGTTLGSLSSDVWGYQFLEIQEKFQYWKDIPPSYNQSEYYLAFPLFYLLSPALEHGVLGYHVGALVIIIATFLITGVISKKFFGNWFAATFASLLVLIPRFVFPTRTCLLDVGSFRGNILALPFYILLCYYWIIYGLHKPRQNILLAICAGILVYLYPPAGIITVGTCIITALIIYKKEKIKQVLIFSMVYLLVASPFLVNHFANPNTGMLDETQVLERTEIVEQSEIVQYKFRGSGFLNTVEFGEVKRAIWDETLLVLVFVVSLGLIVRKKIPADDSFYSITKITSWFVFITIFFIAVIEIVNTFMIGRGSLPIFIDHLRTMRAVGIILLFQAVAFIVFITGKGKMRNILAGIIVFLLILMPIRFSAPFIRNVVRVMVPNDIRTKYNLAPVVLAEDVLFYKNIEDISLWARVNLDEDVKIFVFNDTQNEFRFKVLSHHNTNLTSKEGNLWVTSGFENSKRWYEERKRYEEVVNNAKTFREIADFAKELDCTHILIPRGKFLDLYNSSKQKIGEIIYENQDYTIVEF